MGFDRGEFSVERKKLREEFLGDDERLAAEERNSAPVCGEQFFRFADGERVTCVLAAGHQCAHAFGG